MIVCFGTEFKLELFNPTIFLRQMQITWQHYCSVKEGGKSEKEAARDPGILEGPEIGWVSIAGVDTLVSKEALGEGVQENAESKSRPFIH